MKASETKFQPIIEGTKQYVVPLFQRPYSWTKKEWDVLWDDMVWLCENDEPKSHFIGSIVTMPTASVPEGIAKFLLIDGQQRLTTIFIVLAVLRDIARRDNESGLALKIEQTMLVNPFEEKNDYFKILPTQIDRDGFRRLVQESQIDNTSRISQCYQFFEQKIKQRTVDVATLSKIITTRLSVVSIVLEHDDNPHLVFESLNAKGRPLTQADLIRNYFFMRIHIDDQEVSHAKYWQPMQVALQENLTEFIRHYLMRDGVVVKQSDVYFTLKDRVGQSNALSALKDVATFADYYKNLLFPDHETNIELRKALIRISRLETTTAYPFLLNCYHDYAEERISAANFVKIIQTLENFVIRRFVCNIATMGLNRMFPLLYRQAMLQSPSSLIEGVQSILQSRGYPKDAEFRLRLMDSKLYGGGDRRVKTHLILESLEASYQHKEQIAFDGLTVEHVMPQTITDWWKNHLSDDWATVHDLYLNTLGNLTLTAYNSELSNDTYPNKKRHLVNSHLELNRYFEEVTSWNRAMIEARSAYLADLALIVWPYFGDEQNTTASADNVTGKAPQAVTILGQKFAVATWRDVLSYTLNTIAELEPDLFDKLVQEYPRLIALEPGTLRTSRSLENGFYIEVNLSAKDIYRFCLQAIESSGLSSSDWFVETK